MWQQKPSLHEFKSAAHTTGDNGSLAGNKWRQALIERLPAADPAESAVVTAREHTSLEGPSRLALQPDEITVETSRYVKSDEVEGKR